MKLQFSLALLLVVILAAAITSAACVLTPVREHQLLTIEEQVVVNGESQVRRYPRERTILRQPMGQEIALRMGWSIPIAIASAFAAALIIRQIKRR